MANFVFAVDVDDVIMRPRTAELFYNALGLSSDQSQALKEIFKKYKKGEVAHSKLYEKRYEILTDFPIEQRIKAMDFVVTQIPKEGRTFIENLKTLGEVYLVSNSDGDIIQKIADELKVSFFAKNKFVKEFSYYGVTKHKPIIEAGVKPDVSISDDPINDAPVLDLAKFGIVIKRKDFTIVFPKETLKKYFFVDTLQEALEIIQQKLAAYGH